jgi:hypothetical protein
MLLGKQLTFAKHSERDALPPQEHPGMTSVPTALPQVSRQSIGTISCSPYSPQSDPTHFVTLKHSSYPRVLLHTSGDAASQAAGLMAVPHLHIHRLQALIFQMLT